MGSGVSRRHLAYPDEPVTAGPWPTSFSCTWCSRLETHQNQHTTVEQPRFWPSARDRCSSVPVTMPVPVPDAGTIIVAQLLSRCLLSAQQKAIVCPLTVPAP